MSQNANQQVTGFRYSAINNLHECKLATWLIYREHKFGFKNPFAKFGITVHDILEEYGKHCVVNKLDTDFDEFDRIKYLHLHKLERRQVNEALALLENIKNNINFANILQYKDIFIERRFPLDRTYHPIDNQEDSHLSSGMDVVYMDETEAHVEDYKTVRAIYTKEFMRNSLQRKIYSFIIMKTFPHIQSVGFVFNFVRLGYRSEELFYTRDQLPELQAEIEAEILALDELLKQEEAPEASPGDFCLLCENRGLCEAYKNGFAEIDRIETEEDAIKLYQQWRVAQLRIKTMEETLKFWVETNHPLRVKGTEFGPVEEDDFSYPDVEKLLKILKDAGVPEGAIYEALGTTKTKVGKIIKKFKLGKDVTHKIDLVTVKGKKTKFKSVKIDEEPDDTAGDEYVDPFI